MKPTLPRTSWEAPIGRGPVLFDPPQPAFEIAVRRKVWDLDSSLHCSVIGTCLTAGELRTLIRKFRAPLAEKISEHELHTIAVSAVVKRDLLAKQIQKALDRRHAGAIRSFAAAKCADELRNLWNEARRAGEIPGAYWAALSHPKASDALVRAAFGDVHMLSHLVGSANRADISRLHRLEEEKAALEERLARQQDQLRDGIVARDRKIHELNALLSARIHEASQNSVEPASETATLNALVADLRKLLDREIEKRARAEERAEEAAAREGRAERARLALEEEATALRAELDAAEAQLGASEDGTAALDLAGLTLLYVGGRPHQVARLRGLVEEAAGRLIHHDGGVEERSDLLPGLVSRADAAFFPVDCISHRAALGLKRLCQQQGKPYLPLRNASLAAMLRALGSAVLTRTPVSPE